ncbi:MAG: hypothetical protein ACE5GW_02065 [Planctomycetota bacterium]
MGVTLRYCDLCGKKIEAGDVAGAGTLKIKDKLFCGGCRPKVLARIEERKRAAAGGEDGPSQGSGGEPRRPRAPVRGRGGGAAGEQKGAPPRGRRAPTRRKGRAGQVKRGEGPRVPAAPSPQPDRQQAPPPAAAAAGRGRRPGGARSPRKAREGAAAGRATPAAPADPRQRRRPRRPSPARKGGGAPPPLPGKDAPGAADAGGLAHGEPQAFLQEKRSNAPLYTILGVIGIASAIGLIWLINQPGREVRDSSKETVRVTAPKEDPRKKESEEAYQAVLHYIDANPGDYLEGYNRLVVVAKAYDGYPASDQAAEVAHGILDKWRAEVQTLLGEIESGVARLLEEEKIMEAFALVEEEPKLLVDFAEKRIDREFNNLRKTVESEKEALKRFEELKVKAIGYAKDGYTDIALEILNAFPTKYSEDAYHVWKIKERSLEEIEKDGISKWLKKERDVEAEIALEKKRKAEAEERQRRELWATRKDSMEWFPHLGKHSLYNWIANSDARVEGQEWKLEVQDGVGVLVADNTYGHDMYIGVFTNHWKDYVLRFDMNLKAGALSISPRTQYVKGAESIGEQTSPMIELSTEEYSAGEWVTITVEVQGEVVELLRSDREGARETFTTETISLPESGGFLFWVPDKTRVEIRDVKTKLIASSRNGAF